MPTKQLPSAANLAHLKHQAKDLRRDLTEKVLGAYQRIREFHPAFVDLDDREIARKKFKLADAQLVIAREYGFASWPRLQVALDRGAHRDNALSHNDRIDDPLFARALDFLDAGQIEPLKDIIAQNPSLVAQTVQFEGDNYFTSPTLLEFVAENPVRKDCMPTNVVDVATVILEAGAKSNSAAVNSTLGLVASGRVAREAGYQDKLIDLFVQYGADPAGALGEALGQGEFGAVRKLLDCGAPMTLAAAASFGDRNALEKMLARSSDEELQLALALAALHGRANCVEVLLGAGADPNRYNPPGGHSHCTALHSAALAGHLAVVHALIAGGARADIPDIHHQATAAGWARFGGHDDIADTLERQL